MLLLILIVFTKELIDTTWILNIEIVLLSLVLLTSLPLAKGTSFFISLLALGIGHYFCFKYQMGFDIWYDAITKNLPLAILFVVAPILSIPLKNGGYLKAFNYYVHEHINHTQSLFGILSSFVFFLGAITNLGSIRITHALVEEVNFPKKFLANVYAVGFSACITWSPYFGSVNLILYYTNVPFSKYVLYGFLYGLGALILGNLFFRRDTKLQKDVQNISYKESLEENNGLEKNKLKQLLLNLVLLLVEVIIGEKLFKFSNMMLLVSVIAIFHSLIWSILIKKSKEFKASLKNYHFIVLQVKSEVLFFLSAGFFGVIMANTPIKGYIANFFQSISGFSTFILIEIIIIITVLLSSVGIHQVITVTTLALALDPSLLGLSSLTFALTLIAGWTNAMALSPLAPFNIVLSGLLKENSFAICFKHNKVFGISLVIFSGLYIMLVNAIMY